MTVDWYRAEAEGRDMRAVTLAQIDTVIERAGRAAARAPGLSRLVGAAP